MDILYPTDGDTVRRYSSIDQYKGHFLTVTTGGRAVPISFDELLYVKCDENGNYHPKSRPVILSLGDDIGYHYPVDTFNLVSDLYVLPDYEALTSASLPSYFGDGDYQIYLSGQKFVTADTNSLGVRNLRQLKIGLSYIQADDTLEAAA